MSTFGTQTWNPHTLPANDNVNPYAFSVDLNGQWFAQKGKMIAYYGQIRFEALSAGPLDSLVAHAFNSPLYAQDWIVAQGQGKLVLADRGFDVNSFDLENGNLTVRAGNLLAFEPGLELKQSIIPGFLTLIGTGRFVAASNGPVHFVEPPIRVDPQALLGWADCPSRATTTTTPTCAGRSAPPGWSSGSAARRARSTSSTSPARGPC
ncbi:AIM24 family protein [Actinomadura madurae]|uniref:AIM24 family protein n=1 Tax=Actinomadura madurae TaxID=1993 RepID=UPI000D85AE24|nr:AIM24 family protein [Actinomadura madurae]SPT56653.1 Protein of uncharacterised function DUF124 [Actinomadura madurae]